MKKYFSLLVLSVLIISCGSDSTYEEQILQYNHFVKQADSLNNLKNYANAELIASKALKITDTLSMAYLERGNAYLGLNKLDDAIDDFSEMIEIEGESSLGYKGRAIANLHSGDKDDFIDDINTYLKHYKNDVDAHELRGDYYSQSDYDNAITDYSFCINRNPGNLIFYLKRGNVYAINDQEKLSVNDYAKYINLNPGKNNDEILYKRGKLNIKSNNAKEAIKDFLMVSQSFHNPDIYNLLGDCYSTINDYNKAIINYSKFLTIVPKSFETIENRGYAYSKINDLNKARTDFKTAAKIKWEYNGFFSKYSLFILFIIIYFGIGLILLEKLKEEYDGKTFKKGYIYLFFCGLFGGHYIYTKNVFQYLLYSILIITLFWFCNYSIISFYKHSDLLWNGIITHEIGIVILYTLIILFAIDIIVLPYIIFTINENIRVSVNDDIASKREIEIHELEVSLRGLRQHLKYLKV